MLHSNRSLVLVAAVALATSCASDARIVESSTHDAETSQSETNTVATVLARRAVNPPKKSAEP